MIGPNLLRVLDEFRAYDTVWIVSEAGEVEPLSFAAFLALPPTTRDAAHKRLCAADAYVLAATLKGRS